MPPEPLYQFEPELRVGTPRPARIKAADRVTLYCFIIFVAVVALIICCFAARDLDEIYALHRHGVTVQGVIDDSRTVHGKGAAYFLSYSFPVSRTRIFDENQVAQEIFERKSIGDSLTVTFLPYDPQIHRIGIIDQRKVLGCWLEWASGLLLWLVPFGALCLVIVCQYRGDLQLARYGIPVPALIVECIAPQDAKTTFYTVTYRFTLPGGEQIRTSSVSKKLGTQLSAGHTVTVLYDADSANFSRLHRALLYSEIVSGTVSFPR